MSRAVLPSLQKALAGVTEDDHVVLTFHAGIARAGRSAARR